MKIKLLISRECVVNGSQKRGQIIDVSKDEALRMLEAGQAVLAEEKSIEKAINNSPAKETRKK